MRCMVPMDTVAAAASIGKINGDNAVFGQALRECFAEPLGPYRDSDLGRCYPVVDPFLHFLRDEGELDVAGAETFDDGCIAVDFGAASGDRVEVVVHVVDAAAVHQPEAPAEDLRGGAVVDGQPARASRDVDADLAKGHMIVVDALVSVAGEEQIVGVFGDSGAQEPPLVGAQVLRFVDDDVPVGLVRRLLENFRGRAPDGFTRPA